MIGPGLGPFGFCGGEMGPEADCERVGDSRPDQDRRVSSGINVVKRAGATLITANPVVYSTSIRRDASLDAARGFAIIGIVLTHVLRGLKAAHLLGDGEWIAAADRVLCLWHLSIFAFVGGLFVATSVSKRSMRTYLQERVFQFLSIYLIWTVLQGTVSLFASRLVNNPESVSALFRIWAPTGQLWYLPYLALVSLVFVPWRPWLPRRAPWFFGSATLLSIAFWGLDGGVLGTQGLGLLIFFVGGTILGVARVQLALQSIPGVVAGVGGLALFAGGALIAACGRPIPPTTGWSGRSVSTVALGVMLALLMSAAVLLFARAVRSWALLVLCGRRSLDIYLAHIILASGTRIVGVKLGLHSAELLVALGLVAGVLGSLVVATALRRVGLAWVFDGPKLPVRKR